MIPRRTCDVLVIGAGPAGSISAILAARAGLATLLIDRSGFPRPKVCGGCLGAAGIDLLTRLGLAETLAGATRYSALHLHYDNAEARFDGPRAPRGVVVLREQFDNALRSRASAEGAQLLTATASSTHLEDNRRVVCVQTATDQIALGARAVVACTGLGGRWLREEPALRERIHPRSRVGYGAVAAAAGAGPARGRVDMHIAPSGYVGLARAGGRTIIAASLSRGAIRAEPPQAVIARILGRSVTADTWRGAPALTRRRSVVATPRLFLAGDACGYVEPITGEGMTWAIASAAALAPIVLSAVQREAAAAHARIAPAEWSTLHAQLIAPRRRAARLARLALAHPVIARGAITALGVSGRARNTLTARISTPYPVPA